MSFLDFCLSSSWEREREWYTKFGYKGKWPQSYLSYFSTGFHWRIFLLSRANRFCSIFFLHWLEEPGVLRVSVILLSSTRSKTGYGSSARYEPCSKTAFLPIYFRWGEGVPIPVWGPSQSFGFSLLPLGVRRPEVTKYQHLVSPVWPTFLPNGHLFDG